MAFSENIAHGVMGDLYYDIYSFDATGVTSGTIVTRAKSILKTDFLNKTAQRGTVDDTTTAGSVALSGLTDGDVGYVTVYYKR